MTHDEMIAALAADKAGKPVQFRQHGSLEWQDVEWPLSWNFATCDYRPKPEPRKARECEYPITATSVHHIQWPFSFTNLRFDGKQWMVSVREVLPDGEGEV